MIVASFVIDEAAAKDWLCNSEVRFARTVLQGMVGFLAAFATACFSICFTFFFNRLLEWL